MSPPVPRRASPASSAHAGEDAGDDAAGLGGHVDQLDAQPGRPGVVERGAQRERAGQVEAVAVHNRPGGVGEVAATLTSNGQITLPKAVREELGLHEGDRVVFPRVTGWSPASVVHS